MSDRQFCLLERLYGTDSAARLAPRLLRLMDEWRPRIAARGASRGALGLTERDVLLIAYPDQLQEPGVPPLRTLAEFCRRRLRHAVSGVHLLPFYPWSSDDGFSVKDYRAVDARYGTWDDLAGFTPHFDLMFDGVFNHVSAEGDWFQRFLADDPAYREFFITVAGHPDLSAVVRPRALPLLTGYATAAGPRRVWTTFGADQVDLNYRNPEVLLAILEVLLAYAARGARFIRLDAVAFLWKEPGTSCLHRPRAHDLIRLMRAVLDHVAPHVLLITETNVPHADNLAYFGDGTDEAQLVYNFALPPLVLHAMATGSAESLTRWARTLILPSDRVTFLNFLASHDGIGLNPVRDLLSEAEIDALVVRAGEHGGFVSRKHVAGGGSAPYELNLNYLDALSNPAWDEPPARAARRFLTAHALLLSLPGVPALYFHSLVGSRGDRPGAESSGLPRRVNREKLDRARLEAELDDPASPRAVVAHGFRELLGVRRAHPAFTPAASLQVFGLHRCLLALERRDEASGRAVLCLHNVGPEPVELQRSELPSTGTGQEFLLSLGENRLDGHRLTIVPWGTAWFGSAPPGPNPSERMPSQPDAQSRPGPTAAGDPAGREGGDA